MLKKIFFLCFGSFLFSCGSTSQKNEIILLDQYLLEVPEPSGLTYADGFLYTVSDSTNKVYKLSLNGGLYEIYKTGLKDLEGIVFSGKTSQFYIASESKRALFLMSLEDGVQEKYKIKGKQHGGSNKGLEGVCFNSLNNNIYVVNEAKPKELLQLNLKVKIETKFSLHFGKDISGMCFDKGTNTFWVLSDESQAIYQITMEGKLMNKYAIPVVKPEGITIDEDGKLYVVSDKTSELFVFKVKLVKK